MRFRDLLTAFCQTAAVAAAFWWLLRRRRPRRPLARRGGVGAGGGRPGRRQRLDGRCARHRSGKSNRCWPPRSKRHEEAEAGGKWKAESEENENAKCKSETGGPGSGCSAFSFQLSALSFQLLGRVWRRRLWTPPSWESAGSANRLTEAACWDRDTLWPKYNLKAELPLANVFGTMSLADYETLAAERVPDTFFSYFILRGRERLAGGVPVALPPGTAAPEDVSLWYRPAQLPRAWIVHDGDSGISGEERCVITHYDPLCVRLGVALNRRGWWCSATSSIRAGRRRSRRRGGRRGGCRCCGPIA